MRDIDKAIRHKVDKAYGNIVFELTKDLKANNVINNERECYLSTMYALDFLFTTNRLIIKEKK